MLPMPYPSTSSKYFDEFSREGVAMSKNFQTLASFVAPSFNTTKPASNWYAKRAYAHFATEAYGVNG
jgi:hypothetical protein